MVPIQVFRHFGSTSGHGAGAGAGEEVAGTAAAELDDAGTDVTGAAHLVQTVDTLVMKIVEMEEEVWVIVLPEDVTVAVTGQTVVVA